jgi:hypothetical protein
MNTHVAIRAWSLLLVLAFALVGCGDPAAICDDPVQVDSESGCTVTWSNCSQDSEYQVQCSLEPDGERTRCQCLAGGSSMDGEFTVGPFCAWNNGTQTSTVNSWCDWRIQ